MIKINNTDISDIKINDTSVSKVMVGSTQVWSTGGPGPEDYIQDGLIFQLDGINKGNNNGYWTDLIGGIQYPLQNVYQVNSNNVYFRNTPIISQEHPTITNRIDISSIHHYLYTIEFCIELDSNEKSDNQIIIGWQESQNQAVPGSLQFNFTNNTISTYTSRSGYSNSYTFSYSDFPNTMTGSMVFTSDNDEHDKILLTINKNEYSGTRENKIQFTFAPAPGSGIGGRQSEQWPRALYGKVYAIRVYDKVLTEEEILHNQQLDIERFNLNIPAPAGEQ